ncbi:MAG: Crp/Fnr family transcriptional regulator [Peptococcaceae bacterium]|nr:Crp/Fnr family transcriptional regulator [Peptococcaceae bacterium]
MDKIVAQLAKIPLFADLDAPFLEEIAALTFKRQYRKGRILFVEDEPGNTVYLLRTGVVKLTKQTEDGREHILHYVNPGEVFAEVVLFDGGTYPATAEVVEEAEVHLIRNSDLRKFLLNHPQVAYQMLSIMARRLRAVQEKIMMLALHDTTRRVAVTLLNLAEEYGLREDAGIRINFSLTNQELAKFSGTTRETVNRILNDLRRMDVLAVDKQQIIIKNRRKLLSMLS